MAIVVTPAPLEGVLVIDSTVIEDERGFFMESWNQRDFAGAGMTDAFVQDSHSRSARSVLRGMHYQDMTAPMAKLVRCTAGRVFDVVVDLRVGSATFGNWFGTELSGANHRQVYVPVGFAHGFQVLSDVADVQYKQTGFYVPSASQVLAWNDSDVDIRWPLAECVLSGRDRHGMTLKDYLRTPAFSYAHA
jgi:dTDP-4-dehydrorhamnose 3,5-epimerase